MGLFTTENSPQEILAEEESEVAEEIWNLINEEEVDLEKIRRSVVNSPSKKIVNRSENALNSLSLAIEGDLENIEDEEQKMENQVNSIDFDSEKFRKAAEHNLLLLEEITERLHRDDEKFEDWLKSIENVDDTEEEVRELDEIDSELEEDLEHLKEQMRNGKTQFQDLQGWIDLSKFN